MDKKCSQCKHWRDKSWIGERGWGVCDNPKNEVKVAAGAILKTQGVEPWAQEEVLQGIRYPDNFGCIFFEPINP
jgi:hypothetical protein